MNYNFSRVDYTVSGITYPGTLKVLPSLLSKGTQKFVVGDKSGVLQVLSVKDEEPVVHFKTLPGKPITSVQTTGSETENIFASQGNEVKGYTQKGKVFLTVETSLSETITSMCISGSDLILGSGRIVTHYRDLKELHSYVCDDRILDIVSFASPNSTKLRLLVLIANKGSSLFEAGQLIQRIIVSAGPSRLSVPPWLHSGELCSFYGAADGSIGIISHDGSILSSRTVVPGGNLGAVMCLGWYSNNDGSHLIVGRHDGTIQLYLVDIENLEQLLRLKYTYLCGEPVTSVSGGCIGVEEWEVVAASFSGRIFGLRPSKTIPGIASLANVAPDALSARRSKLEAEVARLEKQATTEREKYQKTTRNMHTGQSLSVPPLLDIQCELSGATRKGWQEATIISAAPLDMLFIYCNRKLEMQTDTASVLSVCPSQGINLDFLATVRCQSGTRHLWLRIRTGKQKSYGNTHSSKLFVYALPAGAPRVARLVILHLAALPYYSERRTNDEQRDRERPWCELKITGSFSVAEMTSWLSDVLPGEMPRPGANVSFSCAHSLLHTVLYCEYERGTATFTSDDITTILRLKEIIMNCSMAKNNILDTKLDVPEDYCIKAFKMLANLFEKEFKKHRDNQFKKALASLDLDTVLKNDKEKVICDDYVEILKTSSEDSETDFEELIDIIENWFINWKEQKLNSSDLSAILLDLKEALRSCNIEKISEIFANS